MGCLAILALAVAECMRGPETRSGEVEVVAFEQGTETPLKGVEVLVDGVAVQSPMRLLYGRHRLTISARAFRSTVREIHLQQSRLTVRVELRLGGMFEDCGDEPVGAVGGRVTGGNTEGLWVKAAPVVGTGGSESPVATTGFFLVDGLETTNHIVLVMRGKTVLHQRVVKVAAPQTQLKIELR